MNRKFVGFSILGMFLASLLGAGLVYAANGGPSATDRKQLGLFSGNGDFIGTVLDASIGYPSYSEAGGTNFTVYISSLDAITRINQTLNSASILFELVSAGPSGLLYFDTPNCSGKAFIGTSSNPYVDSLSPQALIKYDGTNQRYFVVENQPISIKQSQSYLELGTCINESKTINDSQTLNEVLLPFTLTWPLEVRPI